MPGKKDKLAVRICMFPDDSNQYTLDLLDDFPLKYSYFKNYIITNINQSQFSGYRSSTHDELAKEKGFVDFSVDTRDGMIYLPKGIIVRDAVHEFIETIMRSEGFVKLGLPALFVANKKDLKELVRKFGDRVMKTSVDDKTYLKYASDPVLFAYLRNREIPLELDPLKIYSPDKIYRNELSGEVDKFERPRVCYIEDYHIFTRDWENVIKDVNKMNRKFMDGLCDEWYVSCDVDKIFFEQNQDFFQELVSLAGRPFLFNVLSDVPNYYTFEFKYSYLRSDSLSLIMSNLQMDELNAKRFDIKIGDGYAYIIHGNATGRMEKVFIPLFDQTIKMQKRGEKPVLPLWLSPTQVRIIPTGNNFIDYCNDILKQLRKAGFRIDIDDTELKFNKKIRHAEKEWIPYIIVIGEKEIKSGNITLRVRNGGQIVTTITRFIEELESKLKEYPKIPQHLPVFVSKQININYL